MKNNYDELEKRIGYKFKAKKFLLERALTHSSFSNETHGKEQSYERLEFLGDAVLEMVISDYLVEHFPKMPEGDLTKTRASLVCGKSLAPLSEKLGFQNYLRLSNGENNNGGKNRPSIMCDVFESVTAAIYLDGGINHAKKFILDNLYPSIKQIGKITDSRDYKTQLQELIQDKYKHSSDVCYELVNEEGPQHDKLFFVNATRKGNVIGEGKGHSKKEAERLAAKKALVNMGILNEE